MKKIRFILIIFTFFLTSFLISYSQDLNKKLQNIEGEITDIKDQITDKKAGLSKVNQEILELTSQIGEKEAIIVELQDNLDNTKEEIEAKLQKIDEVSEDIEVSKEKLSNRIKAMSKVNEMSYVGILLESEDIKDFISTVSTMKKITEQDKENINLLKSQKETLDFNVKELNELETNLTNLKNEYTTQTQALIQKKNEQDKNMEILQTDLQSLEELENLKIAESKALNDQIRQMALNNGYSGDYSGLMVWPTSPRGVITSYYGNREHPILKKTLFHSGLDIACDMGSSVLSASDGKVIFAGDKGTYGRAVIIDHGSGITTLYAHLSAIYVNEGQAVSKGDKIAAVGSTGRSTGPHLHFEVRNNGITTNPLDYI